MKTLNPQIQNLNNPQQDKLKRLGEGPGEVQAEGLGHKGPWQNGVVAPSEES